MVFKAYVEEDALAAVRLPDNVLVLPTIPLAALLAHNKTVLLINQAGSNSAIEAIWYRIPMISMPLQMDQV